MKLFIWRSPVHIPYGDSCLFILAPNLAEAKEMALYQKCYKMDYGYLDHKETIELPQDIGEPSEIIEEPTVFCYTWSE